MSYQALYRKYRPRTFSEVAGQEHITTTLKNQIRFSQTTHAYLFCGSRGTGKTSTAKILARALNCESPKDGEPCMECESCRITANDSVDIVEMDAASNSKVEEMRELLEKTSFMPLQLKKKVYIIDEVHMLSNSAFNALLKTLEEPPAHVVFILATTEPHRLPPTIISRCQRFDFHRLRVDEIVKRMEEVLASAGASIERGGLTAIARASEGGMRDALSLADQCLAFCGDHVSAKDVDSVLGSMEEDFLFRAADALIGGNTGEAIRMTNEVVQNGMDLGVFMQDVAMHFRALLMAGVMGDCTDILDCTPDAMQKYKAQAARSTEARLKRTLRLLLEAQGKLKYFSLPRVLLESTLVRICEPEQEVSIEALTDRVERLEKMLKEGIKPEISAKDREPMPATDNASLTKVLPDKPKTEVPTEKKGPEKPAPSPAPQNSASEKAPADQVWKKLLDTLAKDNMPLYCMANYAKEVKSEGGLLRACFEKEAYVSGLERHKAYIQGCVDRLAPGTKVKLELIDNTEKTIEKARAIFGDKLEVVD
jgi:DNA polymerase-3 subunit gamma/tau